MNTLPWSLIHEMRLKSGNSLFQGYVDLKRMLYTKNNYPVTHNSWVFHQAQTSHFLNHEKEPKNDWQKFSNIRHVYTRFEASMYFYFWNIKLYKNISLILTQVKQTPYETLFGMNILNNRILKQNCLCKDNTNKVYNSLFSWSNILTTF